MEKILIKGVNYDIKAVVRKILIISAVLIVILSLLSLDEYLRFLDEDYTRKWGYDDFIKGAILPPIFMYAIICIICFIIHKCLSMVAITVTDKRVYGTVSFGKRVDLPLDSITAVGFGLFKSIAVTTASGAIKFSFIKNRNEIYDTINELLLNRQGKSSNTVIREVSNSNADELKKYRELLDSGVITQEEFDAKKKQLLGL